MGMVMRGTGYDATSCWGVGLKRAVVGSGCNKTVVGITLLCAASVTRLAARSGHNKDGSGIITVFI